MPSDANGVYSLPDGYLVRVGDLILPGQHNPVFEDIADALSARLSRSGTAPMTGPLQAAVGTVAAPGICFDGFETFGFFKTANGIGVTIGGVQVAEFAPSYPTDILKSARYVGELFTWSGRNAPPLCVLPFGQTLSRAAYPALWAFALDEIANGSTFYNNGDGVTTFGIGDLRGRVPVGRDNMGGSGAGRLSSGAGGVDGATLGAAGGAQTYALTLAQLPTGITSNNGAQSISVSSTVGDVLRGTVHDNFTSVAGDNGPIHLVTGNAITSTGSNSISVTSNNTSGTAHPNVQPSIITNFALFAGA